MWVCYVVIYDVYCCCIGNGLCGGFFGSYVDFFEDVEMLCMWYVGLFFDLFDIEVDCCIEWIV